LYLNFKEPADSHLHRYDKTRLKAGVELLSGEDYWAWTAGESAEAADAAAATPPSTRRNLLTAASGAGSLEYVMTALDVLHFPRSGFLHALPAAVGNGRLEVVSLLRKLGADIHSDVLAEEEVEPCPAIIVAAREVSNAMVHYLLFQGAAETAQRQTPGLDDLWCSFWYGIDIYGLGPEWVFQEVEGILWHILLHTVELPKISYTGGGRLTPSSTHAGTISAVAQLWSFDFKYRLPAPAAAMDHRMDTWLDCFQKGLAPILWSAERGVISKYVKQIEWDGDSTDCRAKRRRCMLSRSRRETTSKELPTCFVESDVWCSPIHR
jgi:hypothetical protein